MMNQTIAKGKWKEFKGEMQKSWGKITGDELEKTKGDLKSIAGILEQKYGVAKEEAHQKISDIASRYQEKMDSLASATKTNLKNK